MKRVVLFFATNLAIVLVLSISMRRLGVGTDLNAQGLNLNTLLIFAVIWFSRQQEFRADAGGAQLAGRSAMTAALRMEPRR